VAVVLATCSGGSFLDVLLVRWSCGDCVVAVAKWLWWRCGRGDVVVVLWWWCCSHGVMVLVLWATTTRAHKHEEDQNTIFENAGSSTRIT